MARQPKLTTRILQALAERTNGCYCSTGQIAQMTNTKVNHVSRAIAELVKNNLVEFVVEDYHSDGREIYAIRGKVREVPVYVPAMEWAQLVAAQATLKRAINECSVKHRAQFEPTMVQQCLRKVDKCLSQAIVAATQTDTVANATRST